MLQARVVVRLAMLFSILAVCLTPITPTHAQPCQFVLGFQALDNLIPQIVGNCLEDEQHGANGDGLQHTTGVNNAIGLLVWRKADNWTAYTDGYRTWINGPSGLQERLNIYRFCWEGDATSYPLVPGSPACSSSSSTSVGSAGHPSVVVIARVANGAVLPLLRSGDQVIASSIRDQNGTPITTSSSRFTGAVASLESIGSGQGMIKNLSLSSIDDLNSVKTSIPSDIQYVTYSMEGGITPQSEIDAAMTVVPEFASIVHGLGKKMAWIPTHRIFDNLQADDSLKTMLPSIDEVGYQAQQLFNRDTSFYSEIQEKYQYVKSASPSTLFLLQLWIGINGATASQIRDAFDQLVNYMDVAIVGTSSDQTNTVAVLQELSWRT
jgi:hypothetical protein